MKASLHRVFATALLLTTPVLPLGLSGLPDTLVEGWGGGGHSGIGK